MKREMSFKQALAGSGRNLWRMIPLLFGILLLVSLLSQLLTKSFYANLFRDNLFIDPLIGSIVGSISIGAPAISYVLGGEMIAQGVSLIAITSFIVAWVSVGVITFPIEASFFGKRLALIRNIFSFIFSIIVAITTVLIFNLI